MHIVIRDSSRDKICRAKLIVAVSPQAHSYYSKELPKKSALNLRDYYTVLTRTFNRLALGSRFALLVIPASDTILLRYFEISLNFPQVSWVKTEKIQNIQGRKPMMSEFIKYLKDEDGQTSTEYILLVAVVAMVIFKFKDELNSRLTGLIEKVFGKADTIVEGL